MYLRWVELRDLRNHAHTQLDPMPEAGLLVAVGPNGEGKTNLLEGMHFLYALESPRASASEPLVRRGAESGYVRGEFQTLGGKVLVASQAEGGAEAFCGMTRDPDFGPVLAVGPGGRAVEALGLAAVSVAPLGEDEARALVEEAPGLDPAPAAAEALARTLVALSRLAVDHPRISEIDVNPLILGANGAVAVDALVVVEGGS